MGRGLGATVPVFLAPASHEDSINEASGFPRRGLSHFWSVRAKLTLPRQRGTEAFGVGASAIPHDSFGECACSWVDRGTNMITFFMRSNGHPSVSGSQEDSAEKTFINIFAFFWKLDIQCRI